MVSAKSESWKSIDGGDGGDHNLFKKTFDDHDLSKRPRKTSVVVVTGGNSGVGYAIAQATIASSIGYGLESLELVLACRSLQRGQEARKRLQEVVATTTTTTATTTTTSVTISVIPLDLADIGSILAFAREMERRYESVDALCLNAGYIDLDHIDWLKAVKESVLDFRKAVTYPEFKVQRRGTTSRDGFGLVWQTNVFGHYVLLRELHAKVERAVWTSSIEARRAFYQPGDVECLETAKAYEASKYEMDLVHLALSRRPSGNNGDDDLKRMRTRSYLGDPGISITNVVPLHPILVFLQMLSFYLIRLLGSKYHLMDPLASASALVHLVMTDERQLDPALKYGSRSTRWGEVYIERGQVDGMGEGAEEDADRLLTHFEERYQRIKRDTSLRLRGGGVTSDGDHDLVANPNANGAHDDDVWTDDDALVVENEFRRLREDFSNQGYRQGFAHGQEESLQQGFDRGYQNVAPFATQLGAMRGQIAAVLGIAKRTSDEALLERAKSLQADLNSMQRGRDEQRLQDLQRSVEALTG